MLILEPRQAMATGLRAVGEANLLDHAVAEAAAEVAGCLRADPLARAAESERPALELVAVRNAASQAATGIVSADVVPAGSGLRLITALAPVISGGGRSPERD